MRFTRRLDVEGGASGASVFTLSSRKTSPAPLSMPRLPAQPPSEERAEVRLSARRVSKMSKEKQSELAPSEDLSSARGGAESREAKGLSCTQTWVAAASQAHRALGALFKEFSNEEIVSSPRFPDRSLCLFKPFSQSPPL